ncbi:class I SAM-dependent methyltransferase [Paenibacillus sp. YYML68]|uniref:class I SAM-dependent methyltransferase n=1 Tax=Paenibacillus sp. YYML68 TaxID=2909250 RepID=UPI002491BB79|nr:class I SAM-dependent methyltransferase [Paenibacillus sp. YYML68]
MIWQPNVYTLGGYLGRKLGSKRVIDIGCGNGYKLSQLYPEFELIGIDYGPNLELCKELYPYGSWMTHDLDTSSQLQLSTEQLHESVIICADVIEHLVHPEYLLSNIRSVMDAAQVCILSTPERDLTRGYNDYGPPGNTLHIREWNQDELERLVQSFGLQIVYSGLTDSNNVWREKRTSIIVLSGHQLDKEKAELLHSSEMRRDIDQIV